MVPVAIETGRGLLVACLAATGRDVVVINPMAGALPRAHNGVAFEVQCRDALMLANVLRTNRHTHRSLPKDSDLRGADTQLLGDRVDRRPPRVVVRGHLGDHPHRPLT
jgi:hypothetical protein